MTTRWILLTVISLAMLGCAGSQRATSNYATVADTPGRDTQAAQLHYDRAMKLIDEKQYDKAADEFIRALEADATFGPAHNNLGKVYYQRGDLYRAAWEFQYAINLMPYQPEPRNNLGMVFEKAGQLDQAVDYYREALNLETDNPQWVGNLARARLRRGDSVDQTRDLLNQIVMTDIRPQWRDWAREQLATHPKANAETDHR